jgi:hypothetical protein
MSRIIFVIGKFLIALWDTLLHVLWVLLAIIDVVFYFSTLTLWNPRLSDRLTKWMLERHLR